MIRTPCVLVLAGAIAAAGCATPDLQRGKARLDAGDFEAAEQDLRPLSDLGFPEAKMQLARVYAKRNNPDALKESIRLYRELLAQDPEVAVPLAKLLIEDGNPAAMDQAQRMLEKAQADGIALATVPLLELYSDYPARDPQRRAPKVAEFVAKKLMHLPEAESAVIKWYRRNAPDDARYAKELIRLCQPALDRVPECYVDLARHYRTTGADPQLRALCETAVQRTTAGLLPTRVLERLGWSLVSDDMPGKAQPEAAHAMLKQAAQISTVAKVRLARLLIAYPHLDPAGNPEALLLQAAEQGYPDASLALGRLYLDGKLAPADPVRAEKYFRQAASAPAAHFYLGRIYKRGYLGHPDPIRAAQHYLTAARGGYPRADAALAQLFSDNRGVRPNLPNAYVFATLAVKSETPEARSLLQQIRAAMRPEQLREAERLLKQEIAVRSTLPVPRDSMTAAYPYDRAEASP